MVLIFAKMDALRAGRSFRCLISFSIATFMQVSDYQDYDMNNFQFLWFSCPQVKPVWLKGTAWLGYRGGVCNGCDRFYRVCDGCAPGTEVLWFSHIVHLIVHEFGHMMGLAHAASQVNRQEIIEMVET